MRPSFVFCDADVLKSVKAVIDGAELNAQLFTVDEPVDGFDAIDDLMSETHNEDSFVYVNQRHQKIIHSESFNFVSISVVRKLMSILKSP